MKEKVKDRQVTVMVLQPEVVDLKDGIDRLLLNKVDDQHPYPFAKFGFQFSNGAGPLFDAWVAAFINHGKPDEVEIGRGSTDIDGAFFFEAMIKMPELITLTLTQDHVPVASYGFITDADELDSEIAVRTMSDDTAASSKIQVRQSVFMDAVPRIDKPFVPESEEVTRRFVGPQSHAQDVVQTGKLSSPTLSEVEAVVDQELAASDTSPNNTPQDHLDELSSSRIITRPPADDPKRPFYDVLGEGTVEQKLAVMLTHAADGRLLVDRTIKVLQRMSELMARNEIQAMQQITQAPSTSAHSVVLSPRSAPSRRRRVLRAVSLILLAIGSLALVAWAIMSK